MKEETVTYIPGDEILWRYETSSRKWHTGFIVGRRNQWLIVRLPDGVETEMHPLNVKHKVKIK